MRKKMAKFLMNFWMNLMNCVMGLLMLMFIFVNVEAVDVGISSMSCEKRRPPACRKHCKCIGR